MIFELFSSCCKKWGAEFLFQLPICQKKGVVMSFIVQNNSSHEPDFILCGEMPIFIHKETYGEDEVLAMLDKYGFKPKTA